MKKIAVVGYNGRMGSLIFERLQKNYFVVGIDRNDSLKNYDKLDLVIDFSSHENSVVSAKYCLKKTIPIVIGATGQTASENKVINKIAKKIQVVKLANFSVGIEAIKQIIANFKLNPQKIEIIEKHHKNKKDIPSGTALEIRDLIKNAYLIDPEIISIREGKEIGEHEIKFYLEHELISIKHNVFSRDAFTLGVENVVKNLLK